jgi:hypothetical protein
MKRFQSLLDRHGSDLGTWPKSEADKARALLRESLEARVAHERLTRLESWIKASQPTVSEASVRRVINQTMIAIRHQAQPLSLIDRFRILLAAPVPRVAFVMGLTGIGFALGIALGAPEIGSVDGASAPLLTASADDVLF